MALPLYSCPPVSDSANDRLAWLKQTKAQSIAWLQTQPSYREFSEAVAILSGQNDEVMPAGLSRAKSGEVRRNARELVETLSNLRATTSFKTDNSELYDEASVLNKLHNAWWYMTRPNEQVKGSLQMAFALGTGFLSTEWKPDYHGIGRGDINLGVYGPHNVLPVQLPGDGNYQNAYAVTIVNEMPIAQAHKRFWASRNIIISDRDSPTWMKKGMDKIQQFLSPVLNLFGVGRDGPQGSQPIFPTVDMNFTYVDDPSVNETGHDIQMGEQGTTWAYTVPSMGTMVPTGTNGEDGKPLFRYVTIDEARLYPLRRLLIWCDNGLIYDDTSYWWHGQVPVTPISLDKWVWDAIGTPLTKDTVDLDQSITRLLRVVDDAANTRISPPMTADADIISEDLAETFNPRIPGQMIRITKGLAGTEPIKPLLESTFYDLPPYIPIHIDALGNRIQRIMGVNDAAALMRARQVPSSDSIEKLREMAGPIITGMTNSLEQTLQRVGEQWKWLAFQFMTLNRRLQMLGDDGVTPQDFDYDPGSLIPAETPNNLKDSPARLNRLQRARWFAGQFYFFVVPGSLTQITQMSQKLLFVQLQSKGFPIDPWTMAEILSLPNFGAPPTGTRTIMERWVAWQRIQAEIGQVMAQHAAAGQAAGNPEGQGGGGGGRPPSFSKPAHIESKDGGTRSTISTS